MLGVEAMPMNLAQFAKFIRDDVEATVALVKAAEILTEHPPGLICLKNQRLPIFFALHNEAVGLRPAMQRTAAIRTGANPSLRLSY